MISRPAGPPAAPSNFRFSAFVTARSVALLVALLSSSQLLTGCSTPVTEGSFAAVVDSLMPKLLERHGVAGAQVALVSGGRPWSRGFGQADRDGGVAMTDSTRIGVASISKLVASWGVMILAKDGVLPLDSSVSGFAGEWPLPRSSYDRTRITTRRLLSHTAGLSMLSVPCFPADSARPTLADVLGGAGDRGRVELVREPGAGWSYSGGGFTLLELVVERVTGRAFDDVMRERLFTPLGMDASGFYPDSRRPGAAPGYDERGSRVPTRVCVGGAAAGLITTARDMSRLLVEYDRARNGSGVVLDREALDALTLPVIRPELIVDGRVIDLGNAQMGLGHFIHETDRDHRMVFHSGGNPGVGAYLVFDLATGNGMFVVANSDDASGVLRGMVEAWGHFHRVDPPTFF